MTQKSPTSWTPNPSKLNGVAYSDSSTAYSSATTSYSSSTSNLDTFGKLPEAWSKVSKTATDWSANPSAEVNYGPYDSSSDAYDSSTDNYDGVIAADLADNEEQPTQWSKL